MTKLIELVVIAQNITYIAPTNPDIEQWSSNELLFECIHIALHNPVQIKAGLHICDQFPPLKLIYKSILNQYIKYFNARQQSLNSGSL
jgi:hypothetical protein